MSYPVERNPADGGRASLEFLVAAILVFVPVLVFATITHSVLNAQLATEAAARHAARVFIQHTSLDQSVLATHQAMRHALGQYGIEESSELHIGCRPHNACLRPNSWVDVQIVTTLPLATTPLLPDALPPALTITAEASAQVSRYRGDP